MPEKDKITEAVATLYLLKEQVSKHIDYAALVIEGESWEDLIAVRDNLSQCNLKLELMKQHIDNVLNGIR